MRTGTCCPVVRMDCDAPPQPNAWGAGGHEMPIADLLRASDDNQASSETDVLTGPRRLSRYVVPPTYSWAAL
jgi:hypothetical protein